MALEEIKLFLMKTFYKSLELELLGQLEELNYYTISSPLTSKEFWKEWQEKYSKANLILIGLRDILRSRRLRKKDYLKAKSLVRKYEDIVKYLESLKNAALSARGYFGGYYIEFEEDDDEDLNEGGM